MTTTHELKCWPEFFEDLYRKPFELRYNDRSYQLADRLHLREWSAETCNYTGRECLREIIFLLPEDSPGLSPGYVGLGLGPWIGVRS